MFQSFVDLVSGSPWTYAVILGVAALDAVFPLVPSETVVITAGVIAAAGELSIVLMIASAAAGAFGGDNGAYLVGRTVGKRAQRRLFSGEKGRRAIGWAERMLHERGGYLIVVARFLPGGRTATTFTAGLVRYRWERFLVFAAIAATAWATYAAMLGYIGGRTFEDHPWQGLLVALAVAGGIAVAVEVVRHVRRRRR